MQFLPSKFMTPPSPPPWISPLGPLGVWDPKAKYPCCNSRTEKEYSQSYHVENKMQIKQTYFTCPQT